VDLRTKIIVGVALALLALITINTAIIALLLVKSTCIFPDGGASVCKAWLVP
jgi:hypothetical protein